MTAPDADKLAQIQGDLRSDNIDKRDNAVRELLLWVSRDSSIHASALPIFRLALHTELHPYAANYAVDGIELIAGLDASMGFRLALLKDSGVQMVRATLLAVRNPAYVPAFIETLARRSEADVRIAAIRQLGRLGTSAALPTLLTYLDSPELRPHVVEAMGDLLDPAAIPHLQPLLGDETDAWPIDNHGPMLRVCDLAREAIERLRAADGSITPGARKHPCAAMMRCD
jgi:HEAT repeat protein